ncbi:hypothetical protein QA640_32175 [Bradyrhizobium sp. CB82]|uniref:hypothetical protein n=1 Tax=Bradyrhizobium sp. CB82 TaxID=3039159 RepID=UPI0024B124BE|nr:hypothetical protein [Bradyrhizobium sp. CB82]WFU39019.1 hypothetical protein QA640_32175 [Bradyrhizobium sp. CB82]
MNRLTPPQHGRHLQAAKLRGAKLGGFRGAMPTVRMRKLSAEALQARTEARVADLAPIIKELQATGKTSLRAIAAGLNDQGIPAARGGEWSSVHKRRWDQILRRSSAKQR